MLCTVSCCFSCKRASVCLLLLHNAANYAQAAAKMPTRDRRDYVRRRLRFEYEQNRLETRPERIEYVA